MPDVKSLTSTTASKSTDSTDEVAGNPDIGMPNPVCGTAINAL